jgi:adenosylmethionine-8-amino-7-oxononanoate aminotransferase
LAREVLLRPIGDTVYFMPPYVLSDSEMDLLATRTLEILEATP